MPRYLDPKNDLVFKRVFGEHSDLLISFLNALLPLADGQLIEHVEYLSSEQVPDNPMKRNSIVDVKCIDNHGRQFIVEMQMIWTDSFKNRMLFNSAKAYVRQLDKGVSFGALQPVYGLGILNDTFDHDTENFYHYFQMLNGENANEKLTGIDVILIELPKFKPEKWSDRKMAVLWLKFLKEEIADELFANTEINKALTICEQGAFSDDELEMYDKYWDIIRVENTLVEDALRKGKKEGKEEVVLNGVKIGLSIEQIQLITGFDKDRIIDIIKHADD